MSSKSILEIISEIAKKHDNNTAIVFNNDRLTYSELDERSDKFAKSIINKDVKPGSVIALGLYNDIDLIPYLLAIWKANCVYLPIDPNYPSNRIEMMLKNASPNLLISKRELQLQFSSFKGETYFIDEEDNIPNIELRKPKLDDLAYLMYTSGSTGMPKGIIVDHFALKHSAVAYNELHPEKSIALVAGSISFDPSLLTIVSTLAKGGTLCLYDNRDGIDISRPQDIIDLIDKSYVSFILSTPSFYSKLIQQNKTLSSLKNIDLCG
ncbi:MAG: AMP-binding protein, partial [Verrucomicrobia bacterium]|nr:AMP-binding protein [Verrucomicrobiota bacterium]